MSKKRPKCDHLNVMTNEVSGIPVAVCKDCGERVDLDQFEQRQAHIQLPTPAPADIPVDDMVRVHDSMVSSLVSIPGLEKPFFPVFDVKQGDLVIVLRKKG